MSGSGRRHELNPELEEVFLPASEKVRRYGLKQVAKHVGGIDTEILPDEGLYCLVLVSVGVEGVLLITSRRSIQIRKGHILDELRHESVARTLVYRLPSSGNGVVVLESADRQLTFNVGTPQQAQTVAATIDAFIRT